MIRKLEEEKCAVPSAVHPKVVSLSPLVHHSAIIPVSKDINAKAAAAAAAAPANQSPCPPSFLPSFFPPSSFNPSFRHLPPSPFSSPSFQSISKVPCSFKLSPTTVQSPTAAAKRGLCSAGWLWRTDGRMTFVHAIFAMAEDMAPTCLLTFSQHRLYSAKKSD